MWKIQKIESMDFGLQRQLSVALEDIDATRKEVSTMKRNLSAVDDFIETLKEHVSTSREKRNELMDKLKEREEKIIKNQDKTNECEKLSRDNAVLKNEMQSIVMKLTKEIEDQKKNEETPTQSLKERSN